MLCYIDFKKHVNFSFGLMCVLSRRNIFNFKANKNMQKDLLDCHKEVQCWIEPLIVHMLYAEGTDGLVVQNFL